MGVRVNRADLLHTVLRDGNWHTRRDVFERVGFMLTNNAASELRARGIDVEQRRHKGNYEYRISQAPVAGQTTSTPLDSTPVTGKPPSRGSADRGPLPQVTSPAAFADGESRTEPLLGQLTVDFRNEERHWAASR